MVLTLSHIVSNGQGVTSRSMIRPMICLNSRLTTIAVVAFLVSPSSGDERVSFRRDIRPILVDKCFHCHGPDEQQRQAGLRLDEPESATAAAESGDFAIVPGQSAASALMARVTHEDPELRMPPVDTGKKLDQQEIDLLQRWIDEGASFEQHWSLAPWLGWSERDCGHRSLRITARSFAASRLT